MIKKYRTVFYSEQKTSRGLRDSLMNQSSLNKIRGKVFSSFPDAPNRRTTEKRWRGCRSTFSLRQGVRVEVIVEAGVRAPHLLPADHGAVLLHPLHVQGLSDNKRRWDHGQSRQCVSCFHMWQIRSCLNNNITPEASWKGQRQTAPETQTSVFLGEVDCPCI